MIGRMTNGIPKPSCSLTANGQGLDVQFEPFVQDVSSRDAEVEELCSYQREALRSLNQRLADLDREINDIEHGILLSDNKIQALEGLIRKRVALKQIALPPSFLAARAACSRGKVPQRRWSASTNVPPADVSVETKAAQLSTEHIAHSSSLPPLRTTGTVYSEFTKRFEAPRQSFTGPAGVAVVSLFCGEDSTAQRSLQDVRPGCRIWLLYWLDRNAGFWREKVRPPRARGGWRVGVFATRSPHRPTPIGLSLAEVTRVDTSGRAHVHVAGVDVLDESPLIAWKLYDPAHEVHENVRSGWLDDKDKLQPLYYDDAEGFEHDKGNACAAPHGDTAVHAGQLQMSDEVRSKLEYVNATSSIDVFRMLTRSLSRLVTTKDGEIATADGRTAPNWKQQVKVTGKNLSVYPVGAWRVWYRWNEDTREVQVVDVTSGIRQEVLKSEGAVDREAREHKTFVELYGNGPT